MRRHFIGVLARFPTAAARRGVCAFRLLYLALLALNSACGGGNSAETSTPPPQRVAAGPGVATISEVGGLPAGYSLVWSDEFDVDGAPDATKWAYDTALNATGWANHELQYYAGARLENSRVENGNLVIEARHEDLSPAQYPDWGGQHYTSARLITRDRANWTFGFIEARARLPCGVGTWPAIWTLAAVPQLHWPADGEIDIMEHVGFDPGVIHGTVHTTDYNGKLGNQRTATTDAPDACSAFHRYQLTWSPTRITVGMDDHNYFQYANDGSGTPEWPFGGPQYLLLNIAVGGDWGGQHGVDDTIFPVRMEIDYVRVYQR